MLGSEPVEVDKKLWYDGIRNRSMSVFFKMSDQELEQGIEELEEKFQGHAIERLFCHKNIIIAYRMHAPPSTSIPSTESGHITFIKHVNQARSSL